MEKRSAEDIILGQMVEDVIGDNDMLPRLLDSEDPHEFILKPPTYFTSGAYKIDRMNEEDATENEYGIVQTGEYEKTGD